MCVGGGGGGVCAPLLPKFLYFCKREDINLAHECKVWITKVLIRLRGCVLIFVCHGIKLRSP